jgi:hypothetical protein
MNQFKKMYNMIKTFVLDLILKHRIRVELKKAYADAHLHTNVPKFNHLLNGLFKASKAIDAEVRAAKINNEEKEDLKLTNAIKDQVSKHFVELNKAIAQKDLRIKKLNETTNKISKGKQPQSKAW